MLADLDKVENGVKCDNEKNHSTIYPSKGGEKLTILGHVHLISIFIILNTELRKTNSCRSRCNVLEKFKLISFDQNQQML